MAKTKSLIDALRADPDCIQRGPAGWSDKLRITNPSLVEEIDALIDAWNANDPTLHAKCPTKNSLAMWMIRNISGVPTKTDTICRYISARAANGTQR